jgi:hypothetical protein
MSIRIPASWSTGSSASSSRWYQTRTWLRALLFASQTLTRRIPTKPYSIMRPSIFSFTSRYTHPDNSLLDMTKISNTRWYWFDNWPYNGYYDVKGLFLVLWPDTCGGWRWRVPDWYLPSFELASLYYVENISDRLEYVRPCVLKHSEWVKWWTCYYSQVVLACNHTTPLITIHCPYFRVVSYDQQSDFPTATNREFAISKKNFP